MSKAFTRESDDAVEERVSPARHLLAAGVPAYITRRGAERLESRLDDLLQKRRRMVNDGGTGASSGGENRRKVDSEIQKLQLQLSSVIIADAPANREEVAFGAFVRTRDETGEEETYQVVGVAEAAPEENRISAGSPLGRALLSRRVGDKVCFQSPSGKHELTVLKVHY